MPTSTHPGRPGIHYVGILIAAIALFLSVGSHAEQSTLTHQDLTITVRGNPTGTDLVFIPGLTSHWSTFDAVCDAFAADNRCHLIQLPGFAGFAPMQNLEAGFMAPLRDQLAGYVADHTEQAIIIGHSLGGSLGMMLATSAPEQLQKLVLVDSLPFIPVTQNPAATADMMAPIAAQIKAALLSQTRAQFDARVPMNVMGLSNDPARTETLIQWGRTTDQATMAHAMYDLQTQDQRASLAQIQMPVLILGAWAAYENFGSTMATTRAIFESSYRLLEDKHIVLSETGYHFLMWDDESWVIDQIAAFLER